MIPGIDQAAKIPELRRRVVFTLLMLIVYRLGIFVPTPGIDPVGMKKLFDQASSTIFGMVNMFSGGALEHFSVFALGIMPYISVSIIVQLLTTTVKHLEELSKEGEHGRRIITKYTRLGTIALALFQGYAISYGLEQQPGLVAVGGIAFRLKAAITLAAGTAFIMWLGEQITEFGIGNGISLVICAGILARMPSTLISTVDLINTGELSVPALTIVLLFGFATVAFIVLVERMHRKIPVQYPRRAVGNKMTQASTQYMPLKLNISGVIPPIFASAFLLFPATIGQMGGIESLRDIFKWLSPGSVGYEVLYGCLIVFFAFFYTAMIFDPNQIAENLKKNGGFIPTVRPGKDTSEYLSAILSRLTLWGALYLCIICILPQIFYARMGARLFSTFFGGTAVLIVVGVMMDTMAQIESHIVARNYQGFMSKGIGKIRGANRAAQISGRLIRR